MRQHIRSFALAAAGVAFAFLPAPASALTLTTLHAFCSLDFCTDGRLPNAGFLFDKKGNIYGTTFAGGENGDYGTIFELAVSGKSYKFVQLYSFCAQANCTDGDLPNGALIIDKKGNLYGTTASGGANNAGAIFELTPNKKHTKWAYRKLYDFCSEANCTDGENARAGLTYVGAQKGAPWDGKSALFGTTAQGGAAQNFGVAYMLSPGKGKQPWSQSVIWTFCSQLNCSDGAQPGQLLPDAFGNLYGTTALLNGLAFELQPGPDGFSETVLHNFGAGSDGKNPSGGLSADSSGNLYGTTQAGGSASKGTVFEIVPTGANSQESVLYSFCVSGNPCADGSGPTGAPLMDTQGNLYGVAPFGGNASNSGTAWELEGHQVGVLYTFCSLQNCTDGSEPAGVAFLPNGAFIGATDVDGPDGAGGTLFELTP